MPPLFSQHMQSIREAALKAVDPYAAVSRWMQLDQAAGLLNLGENTWDLAGVERILLVAAGKAAVPMAAAVAGLLGERVAAGVVVTKYGHALGRTLPPCLRLFEAGHPLPDENGLAGAQAVRALLTGLSSADRVLVLLSGGASALLPLPAGSLSLVDLQTVTDLLLRCGATIGELNTIRKHLDALKGGQLARLAAPAPLVALVLSDVVGDPLDIIASGPTVPDLSTYANAWQVLERYRLLERIPLAVKDHLIAGLEGRLPETPKTGDPLFVGVSNFIVGSNRIAARAALREADRLGYHAALLTSSLEGEAREVAKVIVSLAKETRMPGAQFPPPACLVLGGETTVTMHGGGKGGRNQELALAAALALEGLPGICLMALATDGTDGPTDAAGAVVDGETIPLARRLGLDTEAALAGNDAYPLLESAGALLRIGPTGTNVSDLVVVLVS